MRCLLVTTAVCLALTGCNIAPEAVSRASSGQTGCAGYGCGPEEGAEPGGQPPTVQPEPEPVPAVADVGDTVIFEDAHGTVGSITLNSVRRLAAREGQAGRARADGSYLIAHFTVTIEEGTGMATPATFSARSANGSIYFPEQRVVTRRFHHHNITAGRDVRGDVAFDVPAGELFIDYRVSGPPLASFRVLG